MNVLFRRPPVKSAIAAAALLVLAACEAEQSGDAAKDAPPANARKAIAYNFTDSRPAKHPTFGAGVTIRIKALNVPQNSQGEARVRSAMGSVCRRFAPSSLQFTTEALGLKDPKFVALRIDTGDADDEILQYYAVAKGSCGERLGS